MLNLFLFRSESRKGEDYYTFLISLLPQTKHALEFDRTINFCYEFFLCCSLRKQKRECLESRGRKI